jgi:hypothetical protein
MEVLWFVLAVALCVGLAWLGLRIEPHFVSKDGSRFLCMGQKLNLQGDHLGRWRETRVVIEHHGGIQVDQKRHMRRTTTFWRVEARSPEAPKRKAVFLLKGHDDHGDPVLLALRLPAKSRAVESLSALVRGAAAAEEHQPPTPSVRPPSRAEAAASATPPPAIGTTDSTESARPE